MAREDNTQIFLTLETGESAFERLSAELAATAIASVLLVPPAGRSLDQLATRQLVEFAQSKGAAALVYDEPDLARQLRADGVHLPDGNDLNDRYQAARKTLGSGRIVGVHVSSRHDAMVLAEAGADYVAFGIPAGVQNLDSARERRLDLIAWWAEIFEVPCVALDVETPELAAALARAGADFIGVRIEAGAPPADVARRIASFAEAIQLALAQ